MLSDIKHAHDTQAYKYASDILEDKVNTGQAMKQSAQRFMNDLERDDIYLDLAECRKIVNFAEKCKHHKGGKAGSPIILDPHQPFFFQQIFGWKWTETGLRRTRRVFKEIARKEYKTTELALGGLYHARIEEPNSAQVFIGATREEQARICVNDIARIILKSPWLRDDFKLYKWEKYYRAAECFPTGAIIGTISKEAEKQDGLDISMSGIDEWHGHKDTSVRDILRSGMGNRHGLEWIITTAGFNKAGPCYQLTRKNGLDLLAGKVEDDEELVFIYEIDDPEDNWENEDYWIQSNPSLKYSKTKLNDLRSQFKSAKNEGGSTEVNFKTKNLNIWTDSSSVWIQDSVWVANHDPRITQKDLIGEPCFAGLDLAKNRDLNSLSLLFYLELWGRKKHPVLNYNWLPEDNSQYRGIDYTKWINEGFIRTTPGDWADQTFIFRDIAEIHRDYPITLCVFDMAISSWLVPQMNEIGIALLATNLKGYAQNSAMSEMERVIASGDLEHFNNPVLRWSCGNLIPKRNHVGHMRPEKETEINKIDPMVALILSFEARLEYYKEPPMESGIESWA